MIVTTMLSGWLLVIIWSHLTVVGSNPEPFHTTLVGNKKNAYTTPCLRSSLVQLWSWHAVHNFEILFTCWSGMQFIEPPSTKWICPLVLSYSNRHTDKHKDWFWRLYFWIWPGIQTWIKQFVKNVSLRTICEDKLVFAQRTMVPVRSWGVHRGNGELTLSTNDAAWEGVSEFIINAGRWDRRVTCIVECQLVFEWFDLCTYHHS